jgi:excisionase family DNA binding protein
MTKVYTATQAARLLGVTTQCVSNLIKRNRLKASRDGKRLKIPPEAMIAYINLRTAELATEIKELKETLKFLQ